MTKIEWVRDDDGTKGKTWNAMTGCSTFGPGCFHCYAERMANRLAGRFGYPAVAPFTVTLHKDRLIEPFRWKKPHRVFVCSMGDLFHKDVPFEFIQAIFGVMALCPQHEFLVLTKRVSRMSGFYNSMPKEKRTEVCINAANKMLDSNRPDDGCGWPLANVTIGTSVEYFDRVYRMRVLSTIPAVRRFVSFEPLIGDPTEASDFDLTGISWVIVGGESGMGESIREMKPDWARRVRDACAKAGVPFFLKQMGSRWAKKVGANHTKGGDPEEWPEDLRVRQTPW